MSETKHTPGPWVVRREGRNGIEIIVRSTCSEEDELDGGMYEPLIADLYRGGTGNIHDARLIAAAPELLAALIDVRDNAASDSPEMWGRVEAAILKAQGGAA